MGAYWIEHSRKPSHGIPPALIPLEDWLSEAGFRSVYAYPYKTAEWIHNNGAVKGLKAALLPVYSDVLFVDIDDDPESGELMIAELEKWGVGFEVWDSGGRSVHLHINLVPMEGIYVPESQLAWLDLLALASGANFDRSIYHPAGLYRLPTTIHAKTGKPKTLVRVVEGADLSIPMLDEDSIRRGKEATSEYEALLSLHRLISVQLNEGGRRFHAWKIVSHCDMLGYGPDYTMKHLNWWNERFCKPQLTLQELESRIRSRL